MDNLLKRSAPRELLVEIGRALSGHFRGPAGTGPHLCFPSYQRMRAVVPTRSPASARFIETPARGAPASAPTRSALATRGPGRKADEAAGRCTQPPPPGRKGSSACGAELRAAGTDPAGGELGRRGGGVLREDGKEASWPLPRRTRLAGVCCSLYLRRGELLFCESFGTGRLGVPEIIRASVSTPH